MNDEVFKLWPELDWIQDEVLKINTANVWKLALERSVLTAKDLQTIPFTSLVNTKVTFIAHKRAIVHIAREAGIKCNEFFRDDLPVDMDVVIAGAILADVGKLLEFEMLDGKLVQGSYGKYLRHTFSGVSIAEECSVPAEVCHIIATYADKGDTVKRTTEAYIVHNAHFLASNPFIGRLKV